LAVAAAAIAAGLAAVTARSSRRLRSPVCTVRAIPSRSSRDVVVADVQGPGAAAEPDAVRAASGSRRGQGLDDDAGDVRIRGDVRHRDGRTRAPDDRLDSALAPEGELRVVLIEAAVQAHTIRELDLLVPGARAEADVDAVRRGLLDGVPNRLL